jgi:hypothetical protein
MLLQELQRNSTMLFRKPGAAAHTIHLLLLERSQNQTKAQANNPLRTRNQRTNIKNRRSFRFISNTGGREGLSCGLTPIAHPGARSYYGHVICHQQLASVFLRGIDLASNRDRRKISDVGSRSRDIGTCPRTDMAPPSPLATLEAGPC